MDSFCGNCGASRKEGTDFCVQCGQPFASTTAGRAHPSVSPFDRPCLVVTSGRADSSLADLSRDTVTIGRTSSNTLTLNDADVSRQHARVEFENGAWIISDLNSKNGTFVNGKPVTRQALRPGDQIRLGGTVLVFQSTAPAARPSPSAAPVTPSRRQGSRPLARVSVIAAAVAVALCLCVGAVALIILAGDSDMIARLGITALRQVEPTAIVEVDQQTLRSLDKSVGQIEAAFHAGDVNTVISLTHPAMRSSYQPIFEAHKTDLKRVADLLATRKLVSVIYGMAEYEVTENGKKFYVTFESWGEQWYLSSL